MLLLMISLLAVGIGSYFAASLLDWPRVEAFFDRRPVGAALATGSLITLVLAILVAGYGSVMRELTIRDLQLLVGAAAYLFGVVLPISVILRRMGYSGMWAVIAFIPIGPLLGLWFLAIKRWPILIDSGSTGLAAGRKLS